jgi:phosphoribosylamine-glycine ligase
VRIIIGPNDTKFFDGQKFIMTSSYSASNYGASYGEGDVIKISLNMDTNQITFYKNGVSQGVAFTVSNGTYYLVASFYQDTNTQITITG